MEALRSPNIIAPYNLAKHAGADSITLHKYGADALTSAVTINRANCFFGIASSWCRYLFEPAALKAKTYHITYRDTADHGFSLREVARFVLFYRRLSCYLLFTFAAVGLLFPTLCCQSSSSISPCSHILLNLISNLSHSSCAHLCGLAWKAIILVVTRCLRLKFRARASARRAW